MKYIITLLGALLLTLGPSAADDAGGKFGVIYDDAAQQCRVVKEVESPTKSGRIYIAVGWPDQTANDHRPRGLDIRDPHDARTSPPRVDAPPSESHVPSLPLIYSKRVGFGDLDTNLNVTNILQPATAAFVVLSDTLREAALHRQISAEITEILPSIKESLSKNPEECALVRVTIDSANSDSGKVYSLRDVNYEGDGDKAINILAPKVISGEWRPAPASGYSYDEDKSFLLCYKLVGGELHLGRLEMKSVRVAVDAIVHERIKQDAENARIESERKRVELEKQRKIDEEKRRHDEMRWDAISSSIEARMKD